MKRREMMRSATALAAAILGGAGLAACRSAPMRQVNNIPFNGSGTMQDRSAQIRRAAAERGWTTRLVNLSAGGGGSGPWGNSAMGATNTRQARAIPAIEATNNRDGHNVVVTIVYDQSSFSIRYVSSVGLNYDGTMIHTYYNDVIDQLVRQIQQASA